MQAACRTRPFQTAPGRRICDDFTRFFPLFAEGAVAAKEARGVRSNH
jgi:hypothetical protein